jgi:tRNA A37 threonylcarbamoyladenosine synthetase subunit TsaC/SUA5/YrdC
VRQAFGDDVEVYLDVGVLSGPGASTIVDVTSRVPTLLRPGALGLAELREVVPELDAGGTG